MKISIITPSYNQEIFIGETILSVLNQDGNYDLEHIIIDGKSTDGTDSILKKYKDKIRIICEKDNGQAEAINKGFSLASGEIIGWLNSDDIYHKDTIRRVIGFFEEHPDKQWAYGKCNIVDAHGMEIRRLITRYKNRRQKKFRLRRLFHENFISQPAVFFRKKFLYETGFLDTDLQYTMDYDLWIRMALKSTPGYIPFYLASFRRHETSKSETSYVRQFKEQLSVTKRYSKRKTDYWIQYVLNQRVLFSYGILNKWGK